LFRCAWEYTDKSVQRLTNAIPFALTFDGSPLLDVVNLQ